MLQYSESVAAAMLGAAVDGIGHSPIMKFWAGAMPATCADVDADTATEIAALTLADPWCVVADRAISIVGAPRLVASVDGTVTYFRIYETTGTACHVQGDVTAGGGSAGAMTMSNPAMVAGEGCVIAGLTLRA
jgi:hypothetical protein